MRTPVQTCAFKNLWKGSEMQALAFSKYASCQQCFDWSAKPMRLATHEHVKTFFAADRQSWL